ncbi:MAG: sigma-54-dependent Fis family transcriptional regulator [Polyangiaceae bacterium]|nr:sigma-54-dependent Fis family transcriptional regulator [Polyangiaceae bacterium]
MVPFLKDALDLTVAISGARRGYIEVGDPEREGEPFWLAKGCSDDDVATIREAFSKGIIAAAVASGQTIVTVSAGTDPRFAGRASVKANAIGQVLCAPIGQSPPLGVIYLQDRDQPGPFSRSDKERVEIFAKHLGTLADRLLLKEKIIAETDLTQPHRKLLRANSIIGKSAALAKVLRDAGRIAQLDIDVLLTGPNGSGKTQLAQVIHENSARASAPFVEINCSTLLPELAYQELFGAEKGAHSTATQAIQGKVAAANGGTLFLDEVGELRSDVQAKLLNFLQSKEYRPHGGNKVHKADVRIIAATNANLKQLVAEEQFRSDLYYRLSVFPIRIPSLSERKEDIPLLAAFFCEKTCEKHNFPMVKLSRGAGLALLSAPWAGNIRELEHVVQRGVVHAVSDGLDEVEVHHLFDEGQTTETSTPPARTWASATREFQRLFLLKTLEENDWKITRVADVLDLARAHVYNLIDAFQLAGEIKARKEKKKA